MQLLSYHLLCALSCLQIFSVKHDRQFNQWVVQLNQKTEQFDPVSEGMYAFSCTQVHLCFCVTFLFHYKTTREAVTPQAGGVKRTSPTNASRESQSIRLSFCPSGEVLEHFISTFCVLWIVCSIVSLRLRMALCRRYWKWLTFFFIIFNLRDWPGSGLNHVALGRARGSTVMTNVFPSS